MSGLKRRVWILVCLLTIGAFGQQKAKPVILRGRVVDGKAKPVEGAEIVAFEKCRHYHRGGEYANMLTPVQRTGKDGKFMLNVITTSQYDTYVVARKGGLALGWDRLSVNHNLKAEGNFYIILERPTTFAGKVVGAEGMPVSGAVVQAIPKTSYLHRLRQRPIFGPEEWLTVTASKDGAFAFKNLPDEASADFLVKAAGCDLVYHYTPHSMDGAGFDVGREDIELILPDGVTIQGKVLEKKSRAGVSGVRLLLRTRDQINEQQQRYKHYEFVSGSDGAFSIRGVPAGRHELRVVAPWDRTAEWIARTVAVNVSGKEGLKNVTVEIEKGAILEVLVRDGRTGRPVGGSQVHVGNKSGVGYKRDFEFFRQAFAGTNGIAHVRVPPGRCLVAAYGNDYVTMQGYKQANAFENRFSRCEILLEPRLKIRGTVMEASGRPASRKIVSVYPFGHTVFTDHNGRFEAKPDAVYPTKLLGVRDVERNLASLTEVRSGSSIARLQLKPALSITGLITDANNIGIPAARVHLNLYVAYFICFVDEVITDNTGRYRIDAIYPEREGIEYRLLANAAGYGPVKHRQILVKGNPGELVNIPPVKLVRADASISGVVVDKNGNPAANIPLFVQGHRRFDQPERSGATDSLGRFVINKVCRGPLKIQADFASSPGGSGNLYARGGDKDVRIVLGQELTHTGHTSLIGKSLPDLSEFGIQPTIGATDSAKMLICFFHLGQRSSRYCVRQLNSKAGQLRRHDVYVVCVQVSNLPEKGLSDWKRQDRISLPVGMVGEDEIKVRQEWGIPSLPWLILTDSNHVVTAEGFRLNDLDEKIREAENAR